jgi:hypothetical protein
VHATVHQFHRSIADESTGWGAALADALHGAAGPVGTCTLTQLAGLEGCVVAFWQTGEAAAAATERRTTDGPVWLDAAAYEVVDDLAGTAADRPPAFAALTCFDRPLSRAESDAAERAGRERLWPAVRTVPGLVSTRVLRADDRSMVVLALATGIETHEATQRAVMATELLPGEDPALLREPDRVHVDRVVDVRLPARAGSAS